MDFCLLMLSFLNSHIHVCYNTCLILHPGMDVECCDEHVCVCLFVSIITIQASQNFLCMLHMAVA